MVSPNPISTYRDFNLPDEFLGVSFSRFPALPDIPTEFVTDNYRLLRILAHDDDTTARQKRKLQIECSFNDHMCVKGLRVREIPCYHDHI